MPRAVVVDPDAPGRLALRDVDAPTPATSEAVVRVAAISLNLGEVRISQSADAGWRPGWDFAGTVAHTAADGSGPKAGARVVGMLSPGGAWGEQIAAPTRALAVLPESVTFAQAATLPIAGLTALHALRRGGLLLGKKVLITGASGGVGHLAVRLARHAGAYVVGAVRTADREALVRDAGAHEVAVGEGLAAAKKWGPYDLILESVGGKTLSDALGLIAPDGACVLFGTSSGSDVTFDAARFFLTGGADLYGLIIFHEVKRTPPGEGLAELVALVADGRLRPHISEEASWIEIGTVTQCLLDRKIVGKAVLHVGE